MTDIFPANVAISLYKKFRTK